MKIRPYLKGDESQIVWLINNTWRIAYKDIFPVEVFDARDRMANERIESFEANLAEGNKICFVAEIDSKIVGVLIGILNTNIDEFDKKSYARINVLYIDKDFQNRGIGRKLFNEFIFVLKQNGIKNFVVGVLKDNKNARVAYEKWGGVLTTYTEEFSVLGNSREEVFYEYDIDNIIS